jgi:hypothetical protein
MGLLLYGSPPASFELDDRTLAHVELVTLAKLRRGEPFAISLDDGVGGSSTLWLNAASTLQFRFTGPRTTINRAWLDALIDTANSGAGLRIVSEPGA